MHKTGKLYIKWHTKQVKGLMQFADNAGPDQLAHSRRLIRAFVARLQN